MKNKLFLFQKYLKRKDLVCHYDKFGYCNFKDHCKKRTRVISDTILLVLKSNSARINTPKLVELTNLDCGTTICRKFQTYKVWFFGISSAYLHPDHSTEGNKNISNEIKCELTSLEKATKATAQHISENVLTFGTKQAHSKE